MCFYTDSDFCVAPCRATPRAPIRANPNCVPRGLGLAVRVNTTPLNRLPPNQGCRMVCFQTKNPNLGKFWRVLHWKMFLYIIWPFGIFYGDLGYFMPIWYILYSGGLFPFLVSCTKKNLATLLRTLSPVSPSQKFCPDENKSFPTIRFWVKLRFGPSALPSGPCLTFKQGVLREQESYVHVSPF
jgi:hypothetical protein